MLAVCAVVTLVALLSTHTLPASPMYEARYETHIHDYHKNTIPEDQALDLSGVVSSDSVVRYLSDKAAGLPGANIRTDALEVITIRVQSPDPDSAALVARQLYATLLDTVTRAADTLCLRRVALYRRHLDSLRAAPMADSTDAVMARLVAALCSLESAGLTQHPYVDLLNSHTAGIPRQLPCRWWVVLAALLVSVLLCLTLAVIKSFEPAVDEIAR